MTDHRREAPGENGAPVPRDMPDQQVREGEDPWDAAPVREPDGGNGSEDDGSGPDAAPGTDEAGSGPRGAPEQGTVHPEHPVPQEPSD
ncbi:hypothetical protein [Streptomyces sp. NPDC004065]|uniref:hypothetical protein n=1 Tax=Streptomyces sp. NPDC004065 TaxID=3364689 RepID=UPI00384D2A59